MDCSKRSAVAGLRDDALAEILSRLPAKFLCRSKCVSKPWRDLIADRLRCKKLPQTLEGFFYGSLETMSSSEDWSSDEGSGYCGSVDGQHYISDDSNSCSGEDSGHCSGEDDHSFSGEDAGKSGSCDKKLSPDVHGHFINLLGKPVPLVDPLFSFLKTNPRIGTITLLDSCGGLVLLGHVRDRDIWNNVTPGYIVCNPATEHWVLVPSSGCQWAALEESLFEDGDDDDGMETSVATYLIFDPAISQHFQLIEFCHTSEVAAVHTYSSETGLWDNRTRQRREWKRGGKWDMHKTITSLWGSTYFNKMLHLVVSPRKGPELIAAIDGEGKICKIIRWLENRGVPVFVGESKGLLHCVSVSGHPKGNSCNMTEQSIWVLEDYGTEEWTLKHTVSFSELFGKKSCQFGSDYNVVTIHPDHNLVFFVQHWDYKLLSYDIDRKEVCHLSTVGCDYGRVTPYFPYFSELPVLSEKHRTAAC